MSHFCRHDLFCTKSKMAEKRTQMKLDQKNLLEYCDKVLENIIRDDRSEPFRLPVDWEAFNL